MNLIEVLDYTDGHYKPVLITDKWQVAYLNSCPEYELEAITKVDVHHKTDEAFVLLEGRAILIAAEIKEDQITFDLIDMKQGVTYNIPKDMWHNIVLYENTRVYIIENDNTHLGDYEFYHFSDEQTNQLREEVISLIADKK